MPHKSAPPPADASAYRVEYDWRGETAYYVEAERRVSLSCIYWGGPAGAVSHLYGMWELSDGRRQPLTDDERRLVLSRVVEHAARHHSVPLETERE